eukprot:m.22357 g.22357  ORF g.22357 m.22357 type:complete len:192 (-) comp11238_c0_seq1:93-668(-)
MMGISSSSQKNHVLVIGLDAAGKTTLLYKLNRQGDITTTIPTIGFNVETVKSKQAAVVAWDVGGRDKIRPLWRHYFAMVQATIFVVDANDRERIDQVKDELHQIIEETAMKGKPVLVLANKQDLPHSMSCEELALALGSAPGGSTQWHIMPACATTGEGLEEAFAWIDDALHPTKQSEPLLTSSLRTWLRL